MARVAKSRSKRYEGDQPRLWLSDREIGAARRNKSAYTADDYRRELKRVEHKHVLVAVVLVLVALTLVMFVAFAVFRIWR